MKLAQSLCVLLVLLCAGFPNELQASSAVVISQVYGGGGNAGSTLRTDFVELFNRTSAAVNITGWSIQYASASGSVWDKTTLSGVIPPGGYFLIALANGAGGSVSLQGIDAQGITNLSATQGKIALVGNDVALTGSCPAGIVDFVGYGIVNCAESAPASVLTNTTALLRAGSGCTDADSNATDFVTGSPSPRNSATTPNTSCTAVTIVANSPTVVVTARPTSRTIAPAELYFAHFAQGGGYQTSFTVTNLSNSATTAFIETFSQAGVVIDFTDLSLPAYGSGRVILTAAATLRTGWARVSIAPTAAAVDISAIETIQLFNGAGNLIMEASVPPGQPDTTQRLPVFEKDGFGTGVALLNTGGGVADVTLTLRDAAGLPISTSLVTMSGRNQTAKFVSELFQGVRNFEGSLDVASTQPVASIAVRQNFGSGIFSTLPVASSVPEVYFSPRAGIAARIIQELQTAQTSIDIAIYSFTRNDIGDALIAAKARGVTVRILADSGEAGGVGSEIARLESAGLAVKRTVGGGGGIMHNKVAIVDQRSLVTGSYNWSTAAEESNDENALFMRDPQIVAAYQSAFNGLWRAR